MYQYEQFFLKALVLWGLEHCQLHWKCCIFSVGELCCSVLSFLLRGDTSLVLLVRMIIQAQEGTQHSQLFSSLWLFVKLKQDTCSCLASAWPLERRKKKKKDFSIGTNLNRKIDWSCSFTPCSMLEASWTLEQLRMILVGGRSLTLPNFCSVGVMKSETRQVLHSSEFHHKSHLALPNSCLGRKTLPPERRQRLHCSPVLADYTDLIIIEEGVRYQLCMWYWHVEPCTI